jgi:hypothetical protein
MRHLFIATTTIYRGQHHMERKEILKVAEILELDIKKNWSSEKINLLIDKKLKDLNLETTPQTKQAVFCGVSPITGEAVYR